ncbi:hypothetical protein (plasmid) [Lactobacillus brevis] [Lactiplantibacillus mudanjiangensis]|uniref:NlpC/P60 family protein n=1 Tax=Lactiplantibacillus mudanjiangensis TaxID=1296538 RepID=UPI001015B8E1|nr:hypothetical protein (plasmid) [Lactobacillus brevis] [Lactiplantibacillus mudanjiangensis]
MTDTKEVRHAGIGIQLNIGGLEEFRRLYEEIDSLLSKFRELKNVAGDFKGLFNGFGNAGQGMKGISRDISDINKVSKELHNNINISNPVDKSTSAIKESYKAIHESQSEMKKYSDSITHLPTQKFSEVKAKIDQAKQATDKTTGSAKKEESAFHKLQDRVKGIHDAVAGGVIGTSISNGMSWIYNEMKSITQQGYELAEGGEQIRDQWKNIGLSDTQAHGMTDQIAEIRGKSNMAGSALDAIQKKFYAVTDSVPKAKELTNEMAAFGMAAGKSGEQIQQVSMGVAKLTGSKKVSAGFFQRSFGQMPALQKAIVKASGMTNKAFTGALQNGKITGSQLQGYLSKAAKNSGKEWSAFSKTTRGQMASISGTFQNLKAVFAAPLVGGISKALDTVDKKKGSLGDVKKQLQDIAKALGTKVGSYVGDGIKFLVKNRKELSEISKDVFEIAKNFGLGVWKAFSGTIKLITGNVKDSKKSLSSVAGFFHFLANQKTLIQSLGKIFLFYFGATRIAAMAKGIGGIAGDVKKLGHGLIYRPDVDVEKPKEKLTGLGKLGSAAFTGISKKVRALNKSMNLLTKLTWAGVIIAAVAAVIAILVVLYKHNKKFRNFVNGLLKWAKKFAVGIGKWFGQAYKAVTKWMSKMVSGVNKRWGNLWKDSIRIIKSAWSVIKDVIRIFYDIFTGKFSDLKKIVPKLVNDMWKLIKNYFKGAFDWLDDLTGGRLSRMITAFSNAWKNIGKDWKSFWNGIDDWFSGIWKSIVQHVQDGINKIIDTLNGGIKAIDWVISKFGGSDKAIGTINHVHLATGTGVFGNQRRAITRPTMAMLNDGHDSPSTGNREMLIHPNGLSELVKGTNVMRMLEPGAEVLNASETRQMMGVDHFAKGTGFLSGIWKGTKNLATGAWDGIKAGASGIAGFAANAWNGAKNLVKTIQKIISHPVKYLESTLKKPSGSGQIMANFADGFYTSMKKQATDWWSQLWSMASGALGDSGSSSGLLAAVQKYGEGKKYVFGSSGPNTFDCSGLVQYALEHAYGISYPHFSGSQIGEAKAITKSAAKPGDLIGNNTHIGVYAGGGNYYSAMSNTTHPNIGMSPISTFPGTPKFGRVAGIKDTAKSKKATTSGTLQKLIKQETGGMMGWISKHLGPLMDNGSGGSFGNIGGESVQRWRPYVKKALAALHLSTSSDMIGRVLRQINTESGGNPKAIGGTDGLSDGRAMGLMQVKPGTFAANGGKKYGGWDNGYASIYAGLNYARHRYGDSLSFLGNGHGYAKGGDVPADQLSVVGEKGWELFKPKSGGHVFDHETSKKILSRGSQKIDIHGATIQMTVTGNADANTVSKLQSVMNDSNDALVEKIRETLGLNDDGGLIV